MKSKSLSLALLAAITLSQAAIAETWQGLVETGKTEYSLGNYTSAESTLKSALSRAQSAGISDNTQLEIIHTLADTFFAEGKIAEADQMFRQCLSIIEKNHGPNNPAIAEITERLGAIAFLNGKFAEAEQQYLRGVTIRQKIKPIDNCAIAADYNSLAACAVYENKSEQADTYLKQASTFMAHDAKLEDQGVVVHILRTKALMFERQGKIKEAEENLKQSLATAEKCTMENDPLLATCLNELGRFYLKQKDYAQAEVALTSAVEIADKLKFGNEHPILEISLANLAAAYIDDQKFDKAESPLIRAIAINEKSGQLGLAALRGNLTDYAKLLESTHRAKLAQEVKDRLSKLIATPKVTTTE